MNARLQIWWLEARRRLARLRGDERLIWPELPPQLQLSPSQYDFACYDQAPLRLSWRHREPGLSPQEWQQQARTRLRQSLGLEERRRTTAEVLHERQLGVLTRDLCGRSFYLRLDNARQVPVTLLWDTRSADVARPLMLCLQGHTSGAHISWGEPRLPIDVRRIARGGDFARQAVGEGYVAVCIEQSCFGERRETAITQRWDHPCIDAVKRALLLGRTLLGDRVDDLLAVLDWLETDVVGLPALDPGRIHAMGNSAGAETALFATALDMRIGGLIAGSCVGSWRRTSGRGRGCPDTAIPGILQWLEYEDVLALCAPRPVLVVNGVEDHLYPWQETEACVSAALEVYTALEMPARLRAEAGPAGHRFYPDIAWPAFRELIETTTA